MKIQDTITIILLIYNCGDRVTETLEHLCALSGEPAIITVDNHSTDNMLAILYSYSNRVQVIPLQKNIGAAARNIAVKQAKTPYVAFADDDTWWEEGALQKAVTYFETYPKQAVITAKIIIEPSGKVDPISTEMEQSPLQAKSRPGYKIVSCMGGASAMRKEVFLAIGGYEPRLFLGGEEELLATDILARGDELRYLPDVKVHHHPSGASVDKLRWYGVRNALWFVWRRRSAKNAWRWSKHIFQTSKRLTFLRGFCGFMAGLFWVVRTRQPIPQALERELEIVDRQRLGSATRSYGK